MATLPQLNAPQPDLRSFIIYDALPARMLAHPVTDDEVMPHIRTGEFAVVDPADREPVEGELFLVQWTSSDRRSIVDMKLREHEGADGPFLGWWFRGVPLRQPIYALDGRQVGTIGRWADGPYTIEGVEKRIVGGLA